MYSYITIHSRGTTTWESTRHSVVDIVKGLSRTNFERERYTASNRVCRFSINRSKLSRNPKLNRSCGLVLVGDIACIVNQTNLSKRHQLSACDFLFIKLLQPRKSSFKSSLTSIVSNLNIAPILRLCWVICNYFTLSTNRLDNDVISHHAKVTNRAWCGSREDRWVTRCISHPNKSSTATIINPKKRTKTIWTTLVKPSGSREDKAILHRSRPSQIKRIWITSRSVSSQHHRRHIATPVGTQIRIHQLRMRIANASQSKVIIQTPSSRHGSTTNSSAQNSSKNSTQNEEYTKNQQCDDQCLTTLIISG